jgi:hypothetical protein
MVARLLHHGMLLVFIPAVLGCAAAKHPSHAPTTAPAIHPLSLDEIKAGLKDLPVWPYELRDFFPGEWLQIVEFARQLQYTNPDTVLTALREYTRAPHDVAPGNEVAAWSKVYILLRVLFDVPSERYDERKHTLPPITGGGFWPAFRSRRECERYESVLSRPILWTKRGPRLFSNIVGYNGKPYDVDREWLPYQDHYKYRNLDGIVRTLRSRVAKEKQRK